MPTTQSIDHIIAANLSQLSKPGVLTVRPGYEIRDHRLSGKQAIVATVHTKKASLPKADALPESIQDIPVDVREATPYRRLRAHETRPRPRSPSSTVGLRTNSPIGRMSARCPVGVCLRVRTARPQKPSKRMPELGQQRIKPSSRTPASRRSRTCPPRTRRPVQ